MEERVKDQVTLAHIPLGKKANGDGACIPYFALTFFQDPTGNLVLSRPDINKTMVGNTNQENNNAVRPDMRIPTHVRSFNPRSVFPFGILTTKAGITH
jgi:hypothetical protein